MDKKEYMRKKMGDDFWIMEVGEHVTLDVKDRLDEAFEALKVPEIRALVLTVSGIFVSISHESTDQFNERISKGEGKLESQAQTLTLALFFKDYLAGKDDKA